MTACPPAKIAAITAAALARGAAAIQRGAPEIVMPQLLPGATAGGAYTKTLVLAYDDGTIASGSPDGIGTVGARPPQNEPSIRRTSSQ